MPGRPSAGALCAPILPSPGSSGLRGLGLCKSPCVSTCSCGCEGFLTECTIMQLSACLHGKLHGANLLFSIEEICFFRKCPCESW